MAQSSQPVIISSTDESRIVEVPVACPVIDLAAGESSPGMVGSSSSSEDEAYGEVAEARHEAAQARVRLLEAQVRERLASRASRSNAASASETSQPTIPHEPVFPVAVTPPRSPWRCGRPLQGMMPPPNPVPEIPLASRPRDPALHALRRGEQREIQMEMAQMRAERDFLNSRSAGPDARELRIEMLYRTMFRESSTAFCTPDAPQAPLAPQVSEAMQAPPSLVLHLMDTDQDRDFRTPDCPAPADPILGSLTPSVSPRPTYVQSRSSDCAWQ